MASPTARVRDAHVVQAKRRSRFTLLHGFVLSLTLHSAPGLFFLIHPSSSEQDTEPLVLDLQGLIADNQAAEKKLQETKGISQARNETATKEAPVSQKPPEVEQKPMPAANTNPRRVQQGTEGRVAPASGSRSTMKRVSLAKPSPVKPPMRQNSASPPVNAGSNNTKGTRERQAGQTINSDQEAVADLIEDYIRAVSGKIQANLIIPDGGRKFGFRGMAKVSFTILGNGEVAPNSLTLLQSSGYPELDASALKTIQVSLPFKPPPQEITIAIGVVFGPK